MMFSETNAVEPNGRPKAYSSRQFILYWSLSVLTVYMCGGIFSLPALIASDYIFSFQHPEYLNALFVILLVSYVGGVFGLCIGLVEKSIIQKQLFINLRHWQLVSVLGGGIGANIAHFIDSGYLPNSLPLDEVSYTVIFISCVSLFQFIELRHYVHHAWLWMPANIIGTFIFSFLIFGYESRSLIGLLLSSFVLGCITGCMMLWLIQTSAYPENKKQQPSWEFKFDGTDMMGDL